MPGGEAPQKVLVVAPEIEAVIDNQTGLPHLWFEQSGPEGERLDVLVVRGTFDFASASAPMRVARRQTPIVFGDKYEGVEDDDVLRAVVVDDGDLVPYKPGTDILVRGSASAPESRPHATWLAGVRVGQIKKTIRLHGPRQFRRTLLGWSLGQAQPVTSVMLDYRLAYGGGLAIPPSLCESGVAEAVKHDGNPAGCGWLPSRSHYKHLPYRARAYVRHWIGKQLTIPAPQIEDASHPIDDPFGAGGAPGLGALARWWAPRVKLQGRYDDRWRRERFPLLPENFDSSYFQSAPSDQVAIPHLLGNESVTLYGLLPDRCDMHLPGWRVVVVATRASGASSVHVSLLDTVRFDLATRQAVLVWRAHFTQGDDPVVDVVLAATAAELTRGDEEDPAVPSASAAGRRI